MKLYDSIGPNPKVVRMFAAEKEQALDREAVDLMAGENRREPHMSRNPMGQTPALELPDGAFLTEIVPICEYLEEIKPSPALIGRTPEERAKTRMWTRRIDINVCEPLANGFRYGEGLGLFQSRIPCIPEASAGLKAIARKNLAWLDGAIAGRDYVAGSGVSLADVLLYCFLEFGAAVGQPLDGELAALNAWYQRMASRPSASA